MLDNKISFIFILKTYFNFFSYFNYIFSDETVIFINSIDLKFKKINGNSRFRKSRETFNAEYKIDK